MDKVLFVCTHNSARSQMAEAFLNRYGAGRFEAESAGVEPGVLNPVVVEVMAEVGLDISKNRTKSVFEFFEPGRRFAYVITVCDRAAATCPFFPGVARQLAWSFEDPSSFQGTPEEIRVRTREVRDAIEARVQAWIAETGGATGR